VLPADVDTPPAAAAASGEAVDVVAKEIRSDETAAVGLAACKPVLAAGSDAVLPEFTDICVRVPTEVVAVETGANVSESTLDEMS